MPFAAAVLIFLVANSYIFTSSLSCPQFWAWISSHVLIIPHHPTGPVPVSLLLRLQLLTASLSQLCGQTATVSSPRFTLLSQLLIIEALLVLPLEEGSPLSFPLCPLCCCFGSRSPSPSQLSTPPFWPLRSPFQTATGCVGTFVGLRRAPGNAHKMLA